MIYAIGKFGSIIIVWDETQRMTNYDYRRNSSFVVCNYLFDSFVFDHRVSSCTTVIQSHADEFQFVVVTTGIFY